MTPNSAPVPWPGLIAIGLGAAIAPMDFAVNVAFPAISEAFALNVAAIRWVVICYVVTYASLMLACGKLGDVIGHRRVFCAGLVTGALAFTACGLAVNYEWLLAARALQGVATALVLSCAPALVVELCGVSRRTWALSRYAMSGALAGIAGPVIGGLVIQGMGWAGVFWFRLPVTLLALLLMMRLPAPPHAFPPRQRFNFLSALLMAAALALLLITPALASAAMTAAFPAQLPWVAGATGAALLAWFVQRERRGADPVLPAAALRNRALLAANLGSVMVSFTGFAIPLLTPYYLVRIGGHNAASMGLLLATATAGLFAASTAAPRVVRLWGQRHAILLGAAMVALAQFAIALWTLTPAAPPLIALIAALVLHGAGIGLFQVSYTDYVVASLPYENRGVAGGLTLLTRTTGVIIAAVVLSSGFEWSESRHLAAGVAATAAFHAAFGTVFWSTAVLLAGLVMLAWVWPARRAVSTRGS
jgi:MFS family permease